MREGRQSAFLALVQRALWSSPLIPIKEDFDKHFAELTVEKQDAAYDLYRQALFGAKQHTQGNFTQLCEEFQLNEQLELLEGLCRPTKGSQDTSQHRWVNVDPAEEATRSRCLAKRQDLEELEDALQEAAEQHARARAELTQKQEEVVAAVCQVDGLAAQMGQIHQASKQWNERPAVCT